MSNSNAAVIQYETVAQMLHALSNDIQGACSFADENTTHLLDEEKKWLQTCYAHLLSEVNTGIYRLLNPTVKLVFGGCFSSGKSSILNRLLQRKELPTSILPETGVCCFIRSGLNRVARIIDKQNNLRETLSSFDSATLENIISLSENHNRQDIHDIDRMELEYPGISIPENTVWIDSPGIGDRYDGNEYSEARAKELYQQADILVWVHSSAKPLKEKEIEALQAHITGNTPSAVLFVYNAWIENDFSPAEWNDVFNTSFFENELSIRYFFDKHSRVLYKNQLHKFSSEVTSRDDNEAYFRRFAGELNKFSSPHKRWVKNFRMKKAGLWAAQQVDMLTLAVKAWEETMIHRRASATDAGKAMQSGLLTALKNTFDQLINSLTIQKDARKSAYSHYSHEEGDFKNWLSKDTAGIAPALEALGDKILDLAHGHMYPYKTREWVETAPIFCNSFLPKFSELPAITAFPIRKDISTKTDWEAVGNNLKNVLDIFFDNGRKEEVIVLDREKSEYNTRINIEAGYNRYITTLTKHYADMRELIERSDYTVFLQNTTNEHQQVLLTMQQQLASLNIIQSTSLHYSKFD